MAWVFLAVMAAAFQTLRFMLQKSLSMGALSAGGATLARFLYAAPFVALGAFVYLLARGGGGPALGPFFWPYALSGALAQILATACVVALFARRNFAVGITLKKTEVMLTALIGLMVLGEGVSPAVAAAIAVGFAGVALLSDPPSSETRLPWSARLFNAA